MYQNRHFVGLKMLFCEPNEYHYVVIDMFFWGFHNFSLRPLRSKDVIFGIKSRYFVSLNNLRVYHISKITAARTSATAEWHQPLVIVAPKRMLTAIMQ